MKKRGEIWWVNFDPAIGQEIKKERPAVIISNDISNKFLKRFQVIPISNQVDKLYPSEARVNVSGKPCKAMADQITTVSELRFVNKVGQVSIQEMIEIEKVVQLQLGF